MKQLPDKELAVCKKRFVLRGALIFTVAACAVFYSMIWPNGMHSLRDAVGLLMLIVLSLGCGLFASIMMWVSLKGWFGG
jgi:membrane glycosyltransferase